MRTAHGWNDYELIDTTDGERLERWGDVLLIRPDPQVIWKTPPADKRWRAADAHYHRSQKGGGQWEMHTSLPDGWEIGYRTLRFRVHPTGFKHTGLFPEQAVNWDYVSDLIRAADRPVRLLNLFAYTGGATLACAVAGAQVCHVDASKGMVQWARENAKLSGLDQKPIRWIVDDCQKFVAREIRRESYYDAIILDPPSYGRGPGGELWKLEDAIYDFLKLCVGVLSERLLFVMLNSYTTGLSPSVMAYLLRETVGRQFQGEVDADEIGLPVTASGGVLPAGATAIWRNLL